MRSALTADEGAATGATAQATAARKREHAAEALAAARGSDLASNAARADALRSAALAERKGNVARLSARAGKL